MTRPQLWQSRGSSDRFAPMQPEAHRCDVLVRFDAAALSRADGPQPVMGDSVVPLSSGMRLSCSHRSAQDRASDTLLSASASTMRGSFACKRTWQVLRRCAWSLMPASGSSYVPA